MDARNLIDDGDAATASVRRKLTSPTSLSVAAVSTIINVRGKRLAEYETEA